MGKMVPTRKAIIERLVNRVGGRKLDVGCAISLLIPEDECTFGLDLLPCSCSKFCQGNAGRLPYQAGAFGVIVAGELIEHLSHPQRFLGECHRVLSKPGLLILTTPNRGGWLERLTKINHPPGSSKNVIRRIVKSRFFKQLLKTPFPPPEAAEYDLFHKDIYSKQELVQLCTADGRFVVHDFYTAPYLGWSSRIGEMVSWVRKAMHRLLPSSLHEAMILVLSKADRAQVEYPDL
jgi:ubiquinone/menaquinone biosynthesis C-methylase UbiE